jgi:hypothetical protein
VRSVWVAAAVGVVLLSACTPAGLSDAGAAAERFQTAVADGDLAAVCGMLSDRARSQLEGSTASDCAAALSRVKLPPTAVGSVSVWGDQAQARLGDGDEAVFLAEFRTGWQVTAAGCMFVAEDLPYDCTVEG